MPELISPKQLARAIGVSESTIKRWCDRGLIAVIKTAGGHRRLEIDAVIRFLQESGHPIVEPSLLGLPSGVGEGPRSIERSRETLYNTLVRGDESAPRQLVFDLLLSGLSMTAVCEDVITPVMHRIGDTWECGDVEVYQERRACEICLRLLHELRGKVASVPITAPLAVGATPSGDNYSLPVSMAELVLRSSGWNAVVLGSNLPAETIQQALLTHRPRMLWMSVSHIPDEEDLVTAVNAIFGTADSGGTAFALGGRAVTSEIRRRLQFSVFCESFRDLERFARSLLPADVPPTPPPDQVETFTVEDDSTERGSAETPADRSDTDSADKD